MMIEHCSNLFDSCPQKRNVHDHPGQSVWSTSYSYLRKIGVAMNAPAALCLKRALERVSRLKNESLTQFMH
jgi:hypothetical protein